MKKIGLAIWLIKEGETLPLDENSRLMRTGALADYLADNGHKVTWWTSSFVHQGKKYISEKKNTIIIKVNERIVPLHSPISYKKNISFRRIIYHKILSLKFRRMSRVMSKPDIIVCSWPTPDFAKEAIEYGKKFHVPIVIDSRDEWPDIFVRVMPNVFKGMGRLLITPFSMKTKYLFNAANGITAVTDSVLEWACNYAGRKPCESDQTIYIGNKRINLTEEQKAEALNWWKKRSITRSDWIICFFSTFGSHTAIDIVIKAVKDLSVNYPDIKLVLGGGGDREKEFKEIAGNCLNIVFAGWLDNIKMTSLMKIAKCGAFSIKNTVDFKDTFNNKAVQYISEGLPILNSLSGFAKRLISEKNMGVTYECESIEDCKEKILSLYNDETYRERLGDNCLKCFYDLFEYDVVNKQFEDYLIMINNNYIKDHC